MSGSRLTALILTAATGAALAGWAIAAPVPQDSASPFGRHRGARQERVRHVMKELDLTGEQRAQVRGVIAQHRAEMRAATLRVAEARAALRQAVQARLLNESAVRFAADNLGRALGDRALLRGRIGAEVRQHLTAEQAARLDALRAEQEGRRAKLREQAAVP